ncbi:MAG: response regulator transcription factor [Pseudomonadota bacterium]
MIDKGTILSIDDDADLQFIIKEYLEGEGYKILRAHDLKEFEAWTSQGSEIDLVLLDLMLKDTEGLALINVIKEKIKAPIIVVSGKTDTTEKIICLEMGADDYMTKPFEMRELTARIRAVMRRGVPVSTAGAGFSTGAADNNAPSRLAFGDWIIDTDQYSLYNKAGQPVELTTGEFKLLEALVVSAGKVLSREKLFDITRSGGGRFDVYDRAIDIQIARIRKKLTSNDNDSAGIIKTVRGVGYILAANVERL